MSHKKKKAIILPGSIKSHLLPSFYLARQLASEYEVYYLVRIPAHEKLVTDQGYHFIRLKTYGIGYYAEYNYVKRKYNNRGKLFRLFAMVKLFVLNQLFRQRRKEVREIMKEVEPDIVLIDIFCAPDYIFFYPYHSTAQIAFFSPMLSTHYTPGFPLVSEPVWETNAAADEYRSKLIKDSMKGFHKKLDDWQMKRCCRAAGIPGYQMTGSNLYTSYFFKNVPELMLAPLQLEFSKEVKRPEQHYLGLCTNGNRYDSSVDPGFDIKMFSNRKSKGKKIVYCSFGTFFHTYEEHMAVARFVTCAVEALYARDDMEVIIAMNEKVLSVIRNTMPALPHIHFFSLLPQLQVLAIADVFITHSGLGSLKEAIACGVPMLAYPLDLRWDQAGNALKVEHHGLGIKGSLRAETPDALAEKIDRIFSTGDFRQRILRFRDAIKEEPIPGFMLGKAV